MTQPIALLIGLAIEIPLVLGLTLSLHQMNIKQLLQLLIIICATNFITHPLAWESNNLLMPYLNFPTRATIIESAAVAVEGTIYAVVSELGWRHGMIVSLVANAASFFAGLVIDYQLF